jgi:hypothetical protein
MGKIIKKNKKVMNKPNLENLKILNITNNEDININIDKRILPLFRTPIILKRINEKKKNKYNINVINSQNKIITIKKMLQIILNAINIYNYHFNNYLKKYNKLYLILYLKKDKDYQFNLNISNYFYIIKKFMPVFKIRSLLYNLRLFFPKRLLKPEPYIRFSYRLRYIAKIYNEELIFDDKNMASLHRIQIIKLIEKGIKIINYFNYLINNKKLSITKNYDQHLINNSYGPNINSQNFEELTFFSNNLLFKKLIIKKLFNTINLNRNNELKIIQTMKSILNYKEFKTESISGLNNNNIEKKPFINQYLKSLSIYNMRNNGIIISYSNIISFHFNTNKNKLIKNIYNLLAGSFKSMYCLISKPVFVITPDKIIIQLFYYLLIPNILKYKKMNKNLNKKEEYKRKKRIKKQYRKFRKIKFNIRIKLRKLSNIVITKIFKLKFKKLCNILSHLFNKPVHLDLIRLHYPYNDNNILVNLLNIMINKIKLRIIIRKLFEKAVIKNINYLNNNVNIIPAFLSGINIRVAGRLLTHRVIPRKTVKTIKRGAAAPGKINFYDVARYTNKNKRGAYSITISSGQNIT